MYYISNICFLNISYQMSISIEISMWCLYLICPHDISWSVVEISCLYYIYLSHRIFLLSSCPLFVVSFFLSFFVNFLKFSCTFLVFVFLCVVLFLFFLLSFICPLLFVVSTVFVFFICCSFFSCKYFLPLFLFFTYLFLVFLLTIVS
jgi:hypothetical protein